MWFWFGLMSAVIGAVAVIYQQHALGKVRSLIVMWAISAFPIPLFLLTGALNPSTNIDYLFFVGTAGSAIVFLIAKLINFVILKRTGLSHIFPLTSLSTIFTYILGIFFLRENITSAAVIGIWLSVIGVYLLQVHKHKDSRKNILEPIYILFRDNYSLLFIFAMFLTGISSILDKTGIIHSFPPNPSLALLSESIVMTVPLTVYLSMKDKQWVSIVRKNFWMLFLNGTIYGLMAIMVFWGFASGPVALVSAVKKMQILFVMILSYFIFSDKPPRTIWWGAVFMIIGVVFTKI